MSDRAHRCRHTAPVAIDANTRRHLHALALKQRAAIADTRELRDDYLGYLEEVADELEMLANGEVSSETARGPSGRCCC